MNEQDPTKMPEEAAPQAAETTPGPAAGEPTQAMPTQAQPVQEAQAQPTPQPQAQPGQYTQPPAPGQEPAQVPPAQVPPTGQPYAAPGAPVPPAGPAPSATPALICGILAIVFCWIPIVGIVLGIVAIVLAGKYFKAGGKEGSGKAGRICGIIGLVLSAIMIVVNCIVMFTALAMLDDYDTSGRYIATEQSSSNASANSSALADRLDDELYDVVDPELDKIKNLDPTMVASIAAIVQESLDDELASEDLSLAILGVDPTELTKAMLAGFDYEHSYTNISGNEGDAEYLITCKDSLDIATEFESQLSTMLSGDLTQYSDMNAAYAAIGQALMTAVEATTATDSDIADFDLTKSGDKWTLDADSWNDEMEYLFGF